MFTWFGVSLALLPFAGLSQSFFQVTSNMLLLRVTPNEFRGRVMGIRSMAIYELPLGLLMTGAIADLWSAPLALAIDASIGLGLSLLITLKLRAFSQVYKPPRIHLNVLFALRCSQQGLE